MKSGGVPSACAMASCTSAQSVSSDRRRAKWASASAGAAGGVCATGLGNTGVVLLKCPPRMRQTSTCSSAARAPVSVKIMPNAPTNPLVVAVAYDGLCTFEFGCAVEVFGLPRPEVEPARYRFAVAAAEAGPLRAAGGITVGVDGGLELLAGAGTVVVPGWRGADAPVPEALCVALRE